MTLAWQPLLRACESWVRGEPHEPAYHRHAHTLRGDPERDAVLVVHCLGMSASGLQLWQAEWAEDGREEPAHRAALRAARLLNARDDLLLLIVRREPAQCVLIDSETVARMAAVGLDGDAELQLGNSSAALRNADALHDLSSRPMGAGERYALLGLRR